MYIHPRILTSITILKVVVEQNKAVNWLGTAGTEQGVFLIVVHSSVMLILTDAGWFTAVILGGHVSLNESLFPLVERSREHFSLICWTESLTDLMKDKMSFSLEIFKFCK